MEIELKQKRRSVLGSYHRRQSQNSISIGQIRSVSQQSYSDNSSPKSIKLLPANYGDTPPS